MWSYIIAYNKSQFIKIPNLNHKIRIRTILDHIGFYYWRSVQVLSNDWLGMVQDLTDTRKYCHSPTNNPKNLKQLWLEWVYTRKNNHHTTPQPPNWGSLQLGHFRQHRKFIFAMQPYFNPAKLIMKYDPIFSNWRGPFF